MLTGTLEDMTFFEHKMTKQGLPPVMTLTQQYLDLRSYPSDVASPMLLVTCQSTYNNFP